MKKYPTHNHHLHALKRIEGQIRGIQNMIAERRYCIDIITQLSAVGQAVGRVQDQILSNHLDMCVATAFQGHSLTEKSKKISEVIQLLKTYRKRGA